MREYNFTREEIKHVLERYAKGGTATITKERVSPATGMIESAAMNLENLICKRPNGPITSGGTQADRQISVGNIRIVINDELRKIMRDYNITREEIKHMLERYSKGGTATITKERVSPATGMIEINFTLDFKNFISERPVVPITSSGTQADGQISVGNLYIVINAELRKIMRDYNITRKEIKHILERYDRGEPTTITKERVNPATAIKEIATLDFKNFISQRPVGPITSVLPTADSIPVRASLTIDSIFQPADLLVGQVIYKTTKIDVPFDAFKNAFQKGYITSQTRNEQAMINRNKRRKFKTDLRAIQMEISRMTGSENTEPRVPQINRGDDEELFES